MQPTFNKKNLFYDNFPHLPALRMKESFGLNYFEQFVIRSEIQKLVTAAYENLVDQHDLRHFDVYGEIGEQFDDNFYRELKMVVTHKLHDENTWTFLDGLMPRLEIEDEQENADFMTKIGASMGLCLPRSQSTGHVLLKDVLILLINYDLEPLSGQELLGLTKVQ